MGIDVARFAVVTAGISVGTLALRALFILLAGGRALPPRLLKALAFVPASIFTGLIIATVHPERIAVPGDPALVRIIALALAAVIAARTRSILWTIVGGMCAMWAIEWVLNLLR